MQGSPAPGIEPVACSERIEVLDVLRGFALLVIFTFNVFVFSGYVYLSSEEAQAFGTYPVDRTVQFLRYIFVENKDFSLFAFLFGVGFGIQTLRAEERGVPFVARYVRRMLVLFLIGLAHAFLLWGGDILVPYSLLGLLLVPLRRAPGKALLVSATAVYMLPIPLYAIMMFAGMPEPYSIASQVTGDPGLYARWMNGFSGESYLGVVSGNAAFLAHWWAMFLFNLYWPDVLGLFLLGLYVGRRRWFEELPAFLRGQLVWTAGLVGLAGNVVFAILTDKGVYYPPSYLGLVLTVVQYLSVPLLCFFYVAGLTLLSQRAGWRRLLEPLSPVGRMSLTNYLMQSVLCVFIFYGVGFGLFTRVGSTAAVAICWGIFLLQLFLSRWWLAHFAHGPTEWIWRRLTYRAKIPLRRSP